MEKYSKVETEEEDEEDEEVEPAYELERTNIVLMIAAVGLSPYWHLTHALSIYLDYLYSTTCIGFKQMPFLINYVWIINMFSLTDFILQLILRNSKDTRRLYNYKTASKFHLAEDVIISVPYYYVYLLDKDEYPTIFDVFEVIVITVNILRLHMLFIHYYTDANKTIGQISTLLVMIRLTLLLLLIVHTFAICWYLIATYNYPVRHPNDGWIPYFKRTNPRYFKKYLKHKSFFFWYLMAFYDVSNTALTIGFGDFRNELEYEQWFACLTMSVGYIMLTGVYTAYFNQCLQVSLKHNAMHHFRTSLIHLALKASASSSAINNRIEKYYREIWRERNAIIDEPDVLFDIPPPFRIQIQEDIFLKAIRNCYILNDLPEDVSRELARYMKIKCYLGGDLIVKRGVVATSMIYIAQGSIDLLTDEDDTSSLMVLGEGSSLCITNLLVVRPARVSFRASGFTVTHELPLCTFLTFINKYRHFYPRIMHMIEGTLNEAYGKYVHLSMVDNYEDPTPRRDEMLYLKNRFISINENRIVDRTKKWFVQDSPMFNLHMLNEWKRKAIESELLKVTPSITVYIPIKEKEELLYDDACLITSFPWMINPSTSFLSIWNTSLFLAVTCSLVTIPLLTAFRDKVVGPVLILCVVLDTMFIIDFIIYIFTPDDTTLSKVSSVSVANKLTRIYTYMDFIAILPLYTFFSVKHYEKLIWRINTFLYCRKVIIYFKNLEANHTIGLTLISILKYVYFSCVGACMIGSIFYMTACYPVDECSPNGWFYQLREQCLRRGDIQYKSPIAVCIYFSAMLLSQMGVGFVVPKSLYGYVFVMVSIFITAIIARYLMATYSASLSLNDRQRELMEDYSKSVVQFLRNFRAPVSLLERMFTYLQVQWERNSEAFNLLENKDLMFDLPQHLKDNYEWECYKEVLMNQTLFRVLAEATNAEFIRHLCHSVERVTLASNDVLTYSGQRQNEFHIILNGYCKLIDNNNKLIKVIGRNSMINFLESLSGVPNLFNVVTYTSCHLVKIRWELLYGMLSFHMRGDLVQLLQGKAKAILDSNLGYAVLRQASEEHIKVITETDKIDNMVYLITSDIESKIEYLEPFAAAGYLQIMRHLMMRVTFTPYGKFVFYWEIVRIICAFLSAIYIPSLRLFLMFDYRFLIPALLLDIMAIADIYVQMHVCYYNENNILISHPLKTAKNYYYNSFLTDFIAFFPLNYIYPRVGGGIRNTYSVVASVADLLAFNRVLQMWRYAAFFTEVCNTTMRPPTYLRVLHYLGMSVVFVTTLNALAILVTLRFIYYVNNPAETMYLSGDMNSPNWYSHGNKDMSITLGNMFEIYVVSLTSISGLAYSVSPWIITPQKEKTFYYMFFVIIVGFIFNNWVVVKLISTRTKIDTNLLAFHNNLVRFSRYLKKADLTVSLKRACKKYYEFLWLETEGVFQDKVFTAVHDTLRTDCLMAAYAPALLKVEKFSSLPPHCLRDIARIVSVSYVCKDVNVLYMDFIYDDIFIVKSGRVDFYNTKGTFVTSLYPGSIFGNFGSRQHVKATCTFRTFENSTFLILKTKDLRDLSEKYEELLRLLNVLSIKKKLYVAVEEVVTANSDEDLVPIWILKIVDYKKYQTANLYIYFTLIVNILAAFLSISHFAYTIKNRQYLLTIFFDLFLLFQIFLSCNTPFFDYQTRKLVQVRRLIRKRYMKTVLFYLRIVAIIPLYFIAFFPFFPPQHQSIALKCLTFNKVLWVYFALLHMNMLMKRVDVNMLVYKSLQSIYTLSMGVHIFTCMWHLVRCDRNDVCNVIAPKANRDNMVWTVCDDRKYVCNMYMVLQALTTAGLGDMLPVNELQMLVLTLCSMGGVFIMAGFIGDIVDILELVRLSFTRFSYQVHLFMTYLRTNKIPEWRISEQFKYCKRIWMLEAGKQMPIFAEIMPDYLKRESNIQLYGRAFTNNFIFGAVPIEFLKQMLVHVKREIYMSNNFIIHKGQASETLYLILQGEVACKTGDTTVSLLYNGSFFGLRSGLFVNVRSMFTYVCLRTTYVIKLKLSSWLYLLEFFPSARAEIYFRATASNITPHPDFSDFIISPHNTEPIKA